MRLSFRQF
ncbi:alpha-fucosidase, partial [Yersinia pestis PY-93]